MNVNELLDIGVYLDRATTHLWPNGKTAIRDWLEKRRMAAEFIVEPHLVSADVKGIPFPAEINFRGERRIVDPVDKLTRQAALLISAIDRIEAAMDDGNADSAVEAAIMFGVIHDGIDKIILWGVDAEEVVVERDGKRRQQKKGGEQSALFANESDISKFNFAYAKHASKRNWAKATAEELVKNYGYASVNERTVRRTVAKLNLRKRSTSKTPKNDNA